MTWSLLWSAKPPTVPGWYWWRRNPLYRPRIHEVITLPGHAECFLVDNTRLRIPASEWGGFWYGPLEEPVDPPLENTEVDARSKGSAA